MTRRLLFMADYAADPVWDLASEAMVDLDSLPVSAATKEAARTWAKRWEELASRSMLAEDVQAGMADGPATPVSKAEEADLERDGRAVWQQLQRELGDDWQIGWVSFPDVRHVQWRPDGAVEPCPPGSG